MVAVDVRRRARQAELDLARRGRRSDGELVGVPVLSRYVDAWHVMNVAVAPELPAPRDRASALLEQLFAVTRDDAQRGYTLEVRVSNIGAIRLYERFGFRRAACGAATTPTTARTP